MVTNNEAENQFELEVEGSKAVAAYRREADQIIFTHTEVPLELEGKGVGSALVEGALAEARAAGFKIVPACSFVRHYVDTHPETHDLLA